MTCPECSNPVNEGVSLCTFCGAPVDPTPPRQPTEASQAKAAVSSFLQWIMPKGASIGEGAMPCLWTPWFIVLWFIPFLGVWVGSALIALNWWNLGKKGWAAWAWAFIILDSVVLHMFLGDVTFLESLVLTFAAWFVVMALPQIWFVGHYYGRSFDRRRWIVPIGLGLILGFALPKAADQIEAWLASSPASTSLNPSTLVQPPMKELTVEEVVEMKSALVWSVEVSWREPYLFLFSQEKKRVGSAVFLASSDRSIFLVTNRHVIATPEDATDVQQCILDGKNKAGFEVVSKKSGRIDLALIRVMTAEPVKDAVIPLAYLNQVLVGQECVAIGNTLGFGISVTTGVVSKLDDMGGFTAIRTSAPISPGNSGGALFRRKDGALIGITTQTFNEDGAQAVNLALPVDYLGNLELIQ